MRLPGCQALYQASGYYLVFTILCGRNENHHFTYEKPEGREVNPAMVTCFLSTTDWMMSRALSPQPIWFCDLERAGTSITSNHIPAFTKKDFKTIYTLTMATILLEWYGRLLSMFTDNQKSCTSRYKGVLLLHPLEVNLIAAVSRSLLPFHGNNGNLCYYRGSSKSKQSEVRSHLV